MKPFKDFISAPSSIYANDSEGFTITRFVILAPFLRMVIGQNPPAPFERSAQEPTQLTLRLVRTMATDENTLFIIQFFSSELLVFIFRFGQ